MPSHTSIIAFLAFATRLTLAQEEATFTHYGIPDSPNCATTVNACGPVTADGFTAAISQKQFGVGPGQGAGPACGTCYELTITQSEDKTPVTPKTITVTVNNLCPIQGNEEWCQVPNQFGGQVHFDLCADSGAAAAFFTSTGSGIGTAKAVPCPGNSTSRDTPTYESSSSAIASEYSSVPAYTVSTASTISTTSSNGQSGSTSGGMTPVGTGSSTIIPKSSGTGTGPVPTGTSGGSGGYGGGGMGWNATTTSGGMGGATGTGTGGVGPTGTGGVGPTGTGSGSYGSWPPHGPPPAGPPPHGYAPPGYPPYGQPGHGGRYGPRPERGGGHYWSPFGSGHYGGSRRRWNA